MNLNISLSRVRRGARDVRQSNGFTLMELLIVIAIILILMLMAIPTIGSLKKKANETSAINSVQVISKAELQYESTYPSNGYACTLTALGGIPAPAPPPWRLRRFCRRPDIRLQVRLHLHPQLQRQGDGHGTDRFNSYSIVAIPQTVGKTGDRGFCSDQFGAITFDPAAAPTAPSPWDNNHGQPFWARRRDCVRRVALNLSLRSETVALRAGVGPARRPPLQPVALAPGRLLESYEGLGIRRVESGTLLLLKPGRMKWEYSSPAGKLFLLDGTYAWFYSRGDSSGPAHSRPGTRTTCAPRCVSCWVTQNWKKELSNLTLAPGANGLFRLTGQPKGPGNTLDRRIQRLTLTVTADGAIAGIEIEETTARSPASPSPAKSLTLRSRPAPSASPRRPACRWWTHCPRYKPPGACAITRTHRESVSPR